MRPAPCVVPALAAIALAAAATQAAAQTSPSAMPPSPSMPSTGATPSNSMMPGAQSGPATPAFTVGQAVKDNTGATIGAISELSTTAGGQQVAVIKMGADSFQVPADRLGASADGAATINLTQAQISGMLHPGSSAPSNR